MLSIVTVVAVFLTVMDTVKACNTPIVAQRGPRGPPGVPGNAGLYGGDLTLVAGGKRSIRESNYLMLNFPIEENNLAQAQKIVRKTLSNLYEKIEKKPDLPMVKDFHSRFGYVHQTLMAHVEIEVKNQKACQELKDNFEAVKDEVITIRCV